MKKFIISILSLAFLAGVTGCDKYLDVNKNEDAPDYVDAHLYLAGILSAYQGFYWDIRALGPLTQMMGTSGYTTFAANYYSQGSDAAGESGKRERNVDPRWYGLRYQGFLLGLYRKISR